MFDAKAIQFQLIVNPQTDVKNLITNFGELPISFFRKFYHVFSTKAHNYWKFIKIRYNSF